MSQHLVIVESPAKAKTIKKYLGPDYEVLASYGHVRDLLPKSGAVDTAHQFAMKYEPIKKNEKHMAAIISAIKKADDVYLATDPDREGEAISWHICQMLDAKKVLKKKPVHRVVFHEITKSAVQSAIEHPRTLSMELVNAQQARRALDYLVGFNLSPLLWKKIRYGLSAGRVQSPALRLLVEREEEIERFVSQEYWDITANLESAKHLFTAKLTHFQNEKLEQFSLTTEQQSNTVKNEVLNASGGYCTVKNVEKKQRKRNPAAPFITSTLQQEAARKLGFTAQRTMRTAQQLYEGMDIGNGAVGLITYMRTDSVNMASIALDEIREFIQDRYGKTQVPDEPRQFRTKSKNAQEAHEAIRPTSIHRTPESLHASLTEDQAKLYDLIWKRTVACQMIQATIDTVSIDFSAGEGNIFRSTGSVITDPGFMRVYQEDIDDPQKNENEEERLLPVLAIGDTVTLQEVNTHQHFTEPPPRFSEATLIKTLEEYGIGRPSTYAAIISTLQLRKYALLENKRFHPTDIGRIVNRFLTQYFTQYVDYHFTAALEDELDDISRGEKEWIPVLETFWSPFKAQVDEITETVKRKDVTQEPLEESCPLCEKPLVIRLGRYNRFIGCTGYPECTYTRNLSDDASSTHPTDAHAIEGRKCPECESDLQLKTGPYGQFIGCTNYPKCHYIESLQKPADTGVTCPECGKGMLMKRKSRKGKIFFSCSGYPACTYALWNEPIAEPCPTCSWPILTVKITKTKGTEWICPQDSCDFKKKVDSKE